MSRLTPYAYVIAALVLAGGLAAGAVRSQEPPAAEAEVAAPQDPPTEAQDPPAEAEAQALAEEDRGIAELFERQCYSCHNIGGGDKKGPDLIGLLDRRDLEWLHRFIPSPTAMRRAGDPTAIELNRQYRPEEMADQLLSREQIDQILALIAEHTRSGQPFIPQTGLLARPPEPEDIPLGRQLFTGELPLENGGPACIACHGAAGVGLFGGGALGPDLTNAAARYNELELASMLKAPAFPVMSRLFQDHELTDEEVVQIYAYLESTRFTTPDTTLGNVRFTAWGSGAMLALLLLILFTWRGRLRGVRQVRPDRTK